MYPKVQHRILDDLKLHVYPCENFIPLTKCILKVIRLVRVPFDFEPPRLKPKIRAITSKLISVLRWFIVAMLLRQCLSFSMQLYTTLQCNILRQLLLAYIKPQPVAYKTVHCYLLTAIGLSAGGSGYFTYIQNMKLVTNKFKSGGLHEKRIVAYVYIHRPTKIKL